ncbi:MAG: ComEC/Rec2 family competence protein [Phycisphaerae bacterium]|nr:ComEC/Rec2 family competence protein [Phycisphaerae bacterium]
MPADAPKRRALWTAAFLGVGIALAHHAPPITPLAWFIASALALLPAAASRRRASIGLLAVSTILVAGGWYALRVQTIPADHLARRLNDQPALLTVEGIIVTAPRVITERAGRLGRFFAASPRTLFELRAGQIVHDDASTTRVRGRLWVAVDGDASAFTVGDRVRALGMARAVPPPANPGERDRRLWATSKGIAGQLEIDAPGAITALPAPEDAIERAEISARRAVERLRLNAHRWLDQEHSTSAEARNARALLRALLLGVFDQDSEEIDRAFTRLGLAHILSISGLNLAILAAAMFLVFRIMGDRPRIEALIAAVAIVGYLLVIPVRAPVARSAVMVLALLAGETAGRRYDRLTILAWSMVIILIIQPLELFSPGFQLSFGVVAALMTLTTPLREQLFGPRPQRDTHGPTRAVIEFFKDAAASSIVAWAVASPLIIYHVGVFSPLGAIATVLLMPLVSFIMGAGYIALLATIIVPVIGPWIAPPLLAAAELLTRIVLLIDAAPGAVVHLPSVTIAWTLLATAAVVWWIRPGGPTGIEGYSRPARVARWTASIIAAAWLAITLTAPSLAPRQVARLDTLDVSDGACHLLRVRNHSWSESAVLFDCGSLRLTIGKQTIPAAVRALGAARVPTVILSHPNVDHYAGLLDMIQPLGVRRVIVGESFQQAADASPAGPVAFMLSELRRMGVQVRTAVEGDTLLFPGARIDILSPPRGATWKRDNDSSLVCRVALARSGASILMTGDIQRDAIIALRERHPDLRPTILELPHHGSYNDAAEDLVISAAAPFIIQSTGPSRLNNARWNNARARATWLTTAADAAVSITIDHQGRITTSTFRQP